MREKPNVPCELRLLRDLESAEGRLEREKGPKKWRNRNIESWLGGGDHLSVNHLPRST